MPAAPLVRLWVHELTEEGRSAPVEARYRLRHSGGTAVEGALDGTGRQAIVSLGRPATLAMRPYRGDAVEAPAG